MKRLLFFAVMTSLIAPCAMADDYTDDIYYNPKKDKTASAGKKKHTSKIVDFSTIDVDEYNRRGQYYYSPVDTIGEYMENEPDFVYTTEIQKYYNPTIVVDNADVLADVLENSYGNVEVVYNFNGPAFSSWYASPVWLNRWAYVPWPGSYWGYPYYASWTWGPSWSWGWGPSFSWSWGPSWAWGPGWCHGPVWGHRPVWHPSHHGWRADYRPGGNRRYGPGRYSGNRYGSSNAGRPVSGNYNGRPSSRPGGHSVGTRPSSGSRPSGGAVVTGRPGQNSSTVSGGSGSSGSRRGGYNSGSRQSSTQRTTTINSNRNNSNTHRNSSVGSGQSGNRGGYSSGSRGGYNGGGRSSGGGRGRR